MDKIYGPGFGTRDRLFESNCADKFMNRNSNRWGYVLIAHERGYRVIEGNVVSPRGKNVGGFWSKKSPYKYFKLRLSKPRKAVNVPCHQLAAYQKYGLLVASHPCVRHADGDPSNNREENILIGSHSQNQLDRPKCERLKHAKMAASKLIKYDWGAIRKDRECGMSYGKLVNKYGMSKSSLAYHFSASRVPSQHPN